MEKNTIIEKKLEDLKKAVEKRLKKLEEAVFPTEMPLKIEIGHSVSGIYKKNPDTGKEEKVGKRIDYFVHAYCGKCHETEFLNNTGTPIYNFCRRCGVKFDREKTLQIFKEVTKNLSELRTKFIWFKKEKNEKNEIEVYFETV
jgi:hypothetical protein